MEASAEVSGVRRGIAVGFLQLLTDDFRTGVYHPVPDPVPQGGAGARDLSVDLTPCVRPFLPCRDVEESTHRFSHDTPTGTVDGNHRQSGTSRLRDAPGNVWPLRYQDAAGATWALDRGFWGMKFVVILGIFRGNLGVRPAELMALQHAAWDFFVEVSPTQVLRLDAQGDDSFHPGAPSGVDVLAASTNATCRMILRSTNLEDPATGARPCRGRESTGPRPPI